MNIFHPSFSLINPFIRMKKLFFSVVLLGIASGFAIAQSNQYPYRNKSLPIEKRVADQLSRMTVEEKAGQLSQLNGGAFTGPAATGDLHLERRAGLAVPAASFRGRRPKAG